MKTFVPFLLTLTAVSISAHTTFPNEPASSTGYKLLHRIIRESRSKHLLNTKESLFILKEILTSAKDLKKNLTENDLQIPVLDVFEKNICTHERLCQAGKVLSGEVQKNGWRTKLHRQLKAYTKKTSCKEVKKTHTVPLTELLEGITTCAQKEFAKPR